MSNRRALRIGSTLWPVGALLLFLPMMPGGMNSALAEPAETQDPSERPPNIFSLNRLDAYMELESSFDSTRVRTKRRPPFRTGFLQKNRNWQIEESVGLQFDATLFGAETVSLTGDLGFGLTQTRFKENNRFGRLTDGDSGYLLDYDLRANLFTGKTVSGSVYGLRRDERIPRRFQPTLKEDRSGFGTSWFFASEKLPLELRYDYLETDHTGNRDGTDDEHFTESTLQFGGDWIMSQRSHVKFSYEHAEPKQEYQGLRKPFKTTRDLFTADHELTFGEGDRHALRTFIHYQEESGDFARDFFEIGPQLTLHHSDDLQTMYKYQFNRERFEGLEVETHRADWQIVHQKYTNLTTTANLFGLYEDVEGDLKTTQYGASVDWQYNRRNRYGHLYANLALAYDTERSRGGEDLRLVLNEAGTFRDPLPIFLRNPNIQPHSLVVTDTTGLILYLVGIDYLITQHRGATQLVRIPTGRIANGTTVLIDYRYQVPTRGKLDTLRVDFNVEQRFSNGITPYYRLSYRNQEDDVSSGFFRRADRTNHHRLGVKYEKKRWTLGGELELFDDSIEPYDAFHANGLWHMVQSPEHAVDGSIRFSRFFFEGGFDRRNVNIFDSELDHRWDFGEHMSTHERVSFRWEDDSVDGITKAWDATAALEYALGRFTAQVSVEYDRLDLPDATESDLAVWFRIRRDIPNVLAKW